MNKKDDFELFAYSITESYNNCKKFLKEEFGKEGRKKLQKKSQRTKGWCGCLMAVRFLHIFPVGIGNGCSATHTAAGDDVFLAGRLPFCVHPKQEEEKKISYPLMFLVLTLDICVMAYAVV